MECIKKINVELSGEMLFEYITAIQGDTASRYVEIVLLNNNQAYTPPDGATAVIRATKPDGTIILNNCEIGTGGTIKAELTAQMLAVCGNVRCQTSLYSSDGGILTSVPFIIKVVSKSANDAQIESGNEFNAIKDASDLATAASEIASEALEKVGEIEESVGAATTAANTATTNANNAADTANAAATAANASKSAADTATAAANAAAQNATEKATAANAAAGTANTAAQNADTAKTAANTAAAAANAAKAAADTAAESATAAKEATEEAISNAETATTAANTAATNANTAAANAQNALTELEGASVARYGVKFGGSANSGATVQRLYNAFGLTANVGTDTETATNDFDNIYPWSGRKRCCGYWDENGSFVVNAYEGEPGYTTDGSNGEVWVETPLFYYKHTYGDDGSEEIVITSHPIGGFEPSPIHINADGSLSQKAYTAAYPMAVVDNKPTSRSGVYTPIMSLNSGMTNARLMGEKYTTTTTAEQYVKCLLMWVEFATRDIQTKMKGCSYLSYSKDHTATVAEEAANRIIISKNYASSYVVGQGIAIGTALGSTNVANNRTVTAIADYDDTNTAISFDGDPVNIAVGNIVFAIAWKTGSCDNVLTSSGSPVSNTSGKYTCIYRGEETPFGNAFEWINDVLFKREGSGTTEDPYSYDIYFLKDPTQYSNGTITNNYTKLNFKLPTADGYVKKLGFDSRFPWLRIPCEAGASSSTYYADYYYRPAYAVTAANVGGYWNSGSDCGPCYWYCNNAPSNTNVNRRARLSYRR
jgi:hypothetical protein